MNCNINHATNFHRRTNTTVYVIHDNSAYYGNHVIVFTTKYHRCTYKSYVRAYVPKYIIYYQGRSQDFSKGGGHSRDTIQGSPTIYGLYRCPPSCISGLSRITVA